MSGRSAPVEPLDSRQLRRVRGALGSQPAGVFEDARGQRYYIKTVDSPAHARNERLAAALYALAGAPTLHYVPTCAANEVATRWQPLDKQRLAQFSEAERRQAQHWLGVHAWLANWDAAGLDGDNQGVAGGQVLTLDLGGALAYRAQGDPKGAAFGLRVDELDTLRTDPDNPQARRLFGDIGPQALQAAVAVVAAVPAERIRACVAAGGGPPALAERLLARQADLAHRGRGPLPRPG